MKDKTGMSMTNVTRILTLAAALAFTGPLLAQETTTEPAPSAEPAEPAPADAASADGLSMGQEPADGVGSTYVKASFEQWEQRCVKAEDGKDPCQLYQLLKDADGNSVAEITLFGLPDGGEAAAGATVVAPLETLLTSGLTVGVDAGKAKIYPFTFCAPVGCIARIGFTAEEVAQFKKGAKAVVTIVPAVAPDQKVVLDVSLKGFTAGFDAVNAANAASEAP